MACRASVEKGPPAAGDVVLGGEQLAHAQVGLGQAEEQVDRDGQDRHQDAREVGRLRGQSTATNKASISEDTRYDKGTRRASVRTLFGSSTAGFLGGVAPALPPLALS